MNQRRQDLLTTINRRMAVLQQEIDRCRGLIECVLAEDMNASALMDVQARLSLDHDDLALKRLVREAIEVLDESRKAFKSKKLEMLRKRLTEALAES
ncbi:MAG: hypothetical protein GX422_01175 [Deltaproteobacteria bacterium]|nr:hypothetical protein [Deltaproteobacteria bacterium]